MSYEVIFSPGAKVRSGLRTAGFEKRVTILFEIQPGKVIIVGIFYGGRAFEPSI